ncbi:probable glutathione S-transferase 7 [Caerostris extrusa]|uniref:Probable glutathione S-transferase 7 n=1 Tax=Caerostris extrusa TaxID=172846 RepID=A0AAV4SNB8_CAEEX|nr:probable glutathione S-transferase 7 [Caerostris extrusa]
MLSVVKFTIKNNSKKKKTKKMSQYRILDYSFTTAAELARAILEYAGQSFEDKRFDKDKAQEAEKGTPFGTLPVLEVGGRVIAQHQSICRYLARQHGLSGKDETEATLCDLVMDGLWHMFSKVRHAEVHQLSKEDRCTVIKKMIAEDAPSYLDAYEKMLKDRKDENDFIVGKDVTWSDIGLTLALAALKYRHGLSLESRPALQAYLARMMEVPQLVEFLLAKRGAGGGRPLITPSHNYRTHGNESQRNVTFYRITRINLRI